ncbi:MAG: hypothetical protein ACK42D_02000 [Candidatus Paceibacteria bacterium]
MTQSKHHFTKFVVMFVLLALIPVILLAQTEENKRDTENTTVRADIEIEAEVETQPETTNSVPARPPVNTRPQEHAAEENQRANTATPARIETRAVITNDMIKLNRTSLEERKDQMEIKRLELQANQTERRAALQVRTQERISNFSASMSNRLEAAVARIEQVITRIETRIEKLKSEGANTIEAERHLTQAKSDIANARSIISTIDNEVVLAITSPEPQSAWTEVRTAYQTARDAIRSAHSNLRNAVGALKLSVEATVAVNRSTSSATSVEESE